MPFVKELSEEFPEITFAKFDTTGKLGWWAHPFSRGEPPPPPFFLSSSICICSSGVMTLLVCPNRIVGVWAAL